MTESEETQIVACRRCGASVAVDQVTGVIEADYHALGNALCRHGLIANCTDFAVQILNEVGPHSGEN